MKTAGAKALTRGSDDVVLTLLLAFFQFCAHRRLPYKSENDRSHYTFQVRIGKTFFKYLLNEYFNV